MKKILIACTLSVALSANMWAQDTTTTQLTAQQREQIIEIDKEYDKKIEEINRSRSLKTSERRQRKKELAKEKRDKINAVANPEKQARKEKEVKPQPGERTYKYEYNTELVNRPKTKEDALKNVDAQLAQIKESYKMEEANIKESSRDNAELKRRKEALKSEYKRKKKRLEDERKAIKEGYPAK